MKKMQTLFGAISLAALVAGGTPAGLATTVFQQRSTFPFNNILFDQCTGEFVQFNGKITVSVQFSTNQNTFHMVNQLTIQADGTGLSTGANYRENFVQNSDENGSFTRFPFERDLISNEHLIGNGAVANETMKETFHVTINGDGSIIVMRTSVELTCNG
jgi:hypothetical protein